jgi:hypothetical protein
MSATAVIPDWNLFGILPPIRPGSTAIAHDRSPYRATSLDLCRRFGHTPDRRRILQGLMALRAELAAAGLANGFQWINGSFAEDCESTRERSPGDVDVVSFVALGEPTRQRQLIASHRVLFYSQEAKARFQVDHYLIATDVAFDAEQARRVAYWYSLWSHRREDQRWKGFVELSLSDDDTDAIDWLARQDHDPATGGTSDEH